MPIFEYHCAKCDANFEALVLGGHKVQCPHCNSKKVQKLLSCCSFKTTGSSSDSGGEFSSSKGSACTSCSATSCKTCGH
jgi:putative FmdB family regulatory protein